MTHSSPRQPIDAVSADTRFSKRVVACYSAVDRFFPACGLFDLTEGIYHGNPATSYEQAQANQLEYLLDQIRCGSECRVLDIGCGYGTLLERIRQRGAKGVGITISPEQFRRCRQKDLDVHLFDYRVLPDEWNRTFDGVIANGSIEHFVRPADAATGRQDGIYSRLFAGVHRLIDPDSTMRLFATTTVHYIRKPSDPLDLLRTPLVYHWGSDNFHWAVLERGWGGYYPEVGQMSRCADGYFDLIEEDDGTEDYLLTSIEWARRIRRALLSSQVIKIVSRSLPILIRAPGQFLTLLLSLYFSDSWNWQFRPPDPPMRLLRQTWEYRFRN